MKMSQFCDLLLQPVLRSRLVPMLDVRDVGSAFSASPRTVRESKSDFVSTLVSALPLEERVAYVTSGLKPPLHRAASFGCEKAVLGMVECCGGARLHSLLTALDARGFTPLHWAARHNHTSVVSAILSKSPNRQQLLEIQDCRGCTSLRVAAAHGMVKAVALMLELADDAPKLSMVQEPPGRFTALHVAASWAQAPVVEVLLAVGGDRLKYARDARGCSALHVAAGRGHAAVVETLVGDPVDGQLVAMQDDAGMTALQLAAGRGYEDVVDVLLKRKVPMTLAFGLTILHMAAMRGHNEVVEVLMRRVEDKEALLYAQDIRGYTALHIASEAGHERVVRSLLANAQDADTLASVKALDGQFALEIAHTEMPGIRLLLEAHSSLDMSCPISSDDGGKRSQ